MNQAVKNWFDQNSHLLDEAADKIFSYSELAGNEHRSAKALCDLLAADGFEIKMGIGNLPTAFSATWGSGSPRIGFLAEYDALPGLGPSLDESVTFNADNSAHGCGHNLLGTGCVGAALAVKAAMQQQNLPGTLIVFGCPEEETGTGKTRMADAGCFDGIDVAVTWHPDKYNIVQEKVYASMKMIDFEFFGVASHAGGMPEMGRSAMDACELLNIGENYLREHVDKGVTMHWAYLVVGDKPNVVPPYAKIRHCVRGTNAKMVAETAERLLDVARGAALMTGTQMKYNIWMDVKDQFINKTLNRVYFDAFKQIEPPVYTQEELDYANKMDGYNGFAPIDEPMSTVLEPFRGTGEDELYDGGSSDVISVSRLAPTVTVRTACVAKRIPFHHWTYAALCNMSIGHKGMKYASQVMALGTLALLENPQLIEQAKSEFKEICAQRM